MPKSHNTMLLPIPYNVDRKLTAVPYISYILVGLNSLVYVACLLAGPEAYEKFLRWGGVVAAHIRPYALLTMHFIHDAPSPMHLMGNMLFLILFGRHVEDTIGRLWFVLLYLFGGAAAAMIQTVSIVLFDRAGMDTPMIGASGAIAALMGVFAVRFYRTRIKIFYIVGLAPILGRAGILRPTALLALGLWGGWELVQALFAVGAQDVAEAGGVAHWAHLGGLVFGAVIAVGAGFHRDAHGMYTLKDAYDFFRNGEMRKSADCFWQLIQNTPDDPNMRHKLAIAYEFSYRPTRALPHYAKAIELYAARGNIMDAARIFRRVYRDPWLARHLSPEIFWRMADYLTRQGAFQDALHAFAALASGRSGHALAERAALRCGDLLLHEVNHLAQAIQWYQMVYARGKDPENKAYAAAQLKFAHSIAQPRQSG